MSGRLGGRSQLDPSVAQHAESRSATDGLSPRQCSSQLLARQPFAGEHGVSGGRSRVTAADRAASGEAAHLSDPALVTMARYVSG